MCGKYYFGYMVSVLGEKPNFYHCIVDKFEVCLFIIGLIYTFVVSLQSIFLMSHSLTEKNSLKIKGGDKTKAVGI